MSALGDWSYWLVILGVVAALGALVYAAWWALFADRAKDRRRCPRCWYDMAYSPGLTCAECGFTARQESQLHKTRRRLGVAALAILAAVAITLWANERVSNRGYAAVLPTRALIWMLPVAGSMNGHIGDELRTRAMMQRMSDSQWNALVGRCAAGDFRARPASDRWIEHYGDFLRQWRRGFVNIPQREAPLLKLPPRIDVRARESWPAGTPLSLAIQLQEWWPWGMECRLRITPTIDGQPLRTTTYYRTGDNRFISAPLMLHLPPPQPAARQVALDVEIARRRVSFFSTDPGREMRAAPDTPWEDVGRQTITLPIQIVESMARTIEPATDPALDSILAQAIGGVVKWEGGPSPVRVSVNLPQTFVAEFNDVAVGVSVELLRDDEIARRLHLWWLAGAPSTPISDRHYGYEVDYENLAMLIDANQDDGRWRLRIRGDAVLALRAGEAAKKFWQGEIIQPMTVTDRANDAPPRAWSREETVEE